MSKKEITTTAKKKAKVVQPVTTENVGAPRITKGIVVSDKMDKTVVVKIDRLVKHLKYHKRYLISKKYKVHDPENRFKKGEEIKFVECQPISKNKKWRAIYS